MRALTRTCLILAAACLATTPEFTGARSSTTAVTGQQIDRLLTRLADWGFAGSVAVVQHGKTVLLAGYGATDSIGNQGIDRRTIFDLGSVSKQFTAVAAMTLVESGQLDLDAPISKYLNVVPADKAQITSHQLLTHTAGLPREVAPDFSALTRDEFEGRALAAPLVAAPGERFAYSNAGYRLVAAIIERVSGQPFRRYVQARLFAPLEMRHTGFYDDVGSWGAGVTVARARGSAIDGQSPAAWSADWSNVGSGGVVSNAEDLVIWEKAMQQRRVISARSWDRVFTPMVNGYGYGWTINSVDGKQRVSHSGRWYAYSSDFRRVPAESTSIIVLSNRLSGADGLATPVATAIQRLLRGEDVRLPPAVLPNQRSAAAACAGSYRLASGGRIEFRQAGRALQVGAFGVDAGLAVNGITLGTIAGDSLAAREARTMTLMREIVNGDFVSLRRVTAPARAERYASALGNWRKAHADSLGGVRDVRIDGALPTDSIGRSWMITARVEFERGVEFVALGWDPAGALTILITESRPANDWSDRFLPTSSDRVAAYDIVRGTLVSVQCAGRGRTRRLEIESGGHRWVARAE